MKHPLVTITRSAWHSMIAQATRRADEGTECYGHLVGRFTTVGAKVHHSPVQPKATCTENSIDFSDEDEALRVAALHARHAPLEVVGTWHSHVFDGPYFAALRQQLSDTDQKTAGTGQVEAILVVMPKAEYAKAAGQAFSNPSPSIQSVAGKYICRAEAWLKQAKYCVVPCRIRVR